MKLLWFVEIHMPTDRLVIEVGKPDPKVILESMLTSTRRVAGMPRRWWNVKKINLWLKLRRSGMAMGPALRLSMLSADEALEILNRCAGGLLGQVGFMTISFGPGGTSFSGVNFGQLELVLTAVADLSTALPPEKREALAMTMDELTNHNWGGVRRAAVAAKKVMANRKAA